MDQPTQPLPPIRAKEPGRNGRRHIVAQARLNADGKPEIYMTCDNGHSRCGCGGWFVLEDLLEGFREVLKEEKGKEAA